MNDDTQRNYSAPEWLQTRNTDNDGDAHIRDAILYQLRNSSADQVLQDTRLLVRGETLMECNPIYLFELKKLLEAKMVDIPVEKDKHEHISTLLLKYLFPDMWEELQGHST